MSDKFVTIAEYSIPLEAQLAAGLLDAEGIDAIVAGGLTDAFSGVGGLGGTVELRVPEDDAERAAAILAAHADQLQAKEGWEEEGEAEADVWVCSLCGEAMPLVEEACLDCGTPRDAIQGPDSALTTRPTRKAAPPNRAEKVERRDQLSPTDPVEPFGELAEDPAEVPSPESFLGDDLARRAFRAALLGPLFCPLTVYSLWLQMRLTLFPHELSPYALSRLRWTFLINAIVLLGLTGFVWSFRYFGAD